LFDLGKKQEAIIWYNKTLELNPNHATAHYNKGVALASIGQKTEAVDCYDKALKLNPNYAGAYFNKGNILGDLGQKIEAVDCYDKALELNPNHAGTYLNKGAALDALGKKEEALNCFNKALELNPNHACAYLNKCNALASLGKKEEALNCFNKALELNLNHACAYLNKGTALASLGKKQEALIWYNKALELNSNHADAHYNKGVALASIGQKTEAVDCYDKALKLNPNYAGAYLSKGLVLDSLGHKKEALIWYNKALELNPNYATAYFNKGAILNSLGEKEQAIDCYDMAIQINPNNADAYYNKGVAFDDLGQKTEAVDCYDKALELNPNYADAYLNKGAILNSLGEKEQAIDYYDMAIQINPNNETAYLNKGNILDDLGRKTEAVDCYDKALELNPNYADAYLNKGAILNSLGEKEQAIDCYDMAIQINPNNETAYLNKGNILDDLGRKTEAVDCYDKALELNPNYASAYLSKGVALATLGHKEEALNWVNKAVKLDPTAAKFFIQGLTLAELDQKEAAIESYNRALELNPNYKDAYFRKGDALYALDQKKAALNCYDTAIKIKLNLENAYFHKGNTLALLDNQKEAIKCYDMAIQINPNNEHAYYNKGVAFHNLDQEEEAIKCYDMAIQINPNYEHAYFNKGIALEDSLGDKKEALDCFNKVLELNPKDAKSYFHKGVALADLGSKKEAIEFYNIAIQINSNYEHAYFNKGNTLYNLGQLQEAIRCYDIVIEINPNLSLFHFRKGLALYSLGDKEKAIEHYDSALKINPNLTEFYFHKGLALMNLGRNEEAIKCYDMVIKIDPNLDQPYFNKGSALANLGKAESAITYYNKAIQLNQSYAEAYLNKGNALYSIGQKEALSYYIDLSQGINFYQKKEYAQAIAILDRAIKTPYLIHSQKENLTYISKLELITPYYFKLLIYRALENKNELRKCMQTCKEQGYFEDVCIRLAKHKAIDDRFLNLLYDDTHSFAQDLGLIHDKATLDYFEDLRSFTKGPLKIIKKGRHFEKVLQELLQETENQLQETKEHEDELNKRIESISKLDVITTAKNTITQLLKTNPSYPDAIANIDNLIDKLKEILEKWLLQPETLLLYQNENITNPDEAVKSFSDLSLSDQDLLLNSKDLTKESKVFASISTVQNKIAKLLYLLKQDLKDANLLNTHQAIIEELDKAHNYYTSYIEELCTSNGEARRLQLQPKTLLQSDGMYRYLDESVAEQIIGKVTEDGTLEADPKQQSDGQHIVRTFKKMVFKYKPYRPGIEFMVSKLLDSNYLTAATRLINIKKQGTNYPFLVSKEVEGQDLHYLLTAKPAEFLEKLDSTNFAYIFALTLLTNPRDGKADNYFVTFDIKPGTKEIDKYRIIGIDNDMSFVKGFSKYKDGQCDVNVRSLIYFFPQMQNVINENFRNEFLKLEPEVVILKWLKKLYTQNKSYQKMKEQGVFRTIDYEGEEGKLNEEGETDRGMSLPIKLKEGLVSELYFKLCLIKESMTKDPNLTYQDLFEKVQTKVVSTYYNSLKSADSEEKSECKPNSDLATKGKKILDSMANLWLKSKNYPAIKDKIDISLITRSDRAELGKLASLLVKTEKSEEEEELWTQEINKSITNFLRLIDKVYQEKALGGCIYYTILDHVVQEGNQGVAEELVEKLHELDNLNSYIANKHGQETLEVLLKEDYSDIAKYLIEHCAKPVNNNSEAAKPDTEEEEEEKFDIYNIEQKEIAPYTYEIRDQDTQYIMVDAPYRIRHHDLLDLQEFQEFIEIKENQVYFPLQYSSDISDIKEQETKQAEINLAQKLIAQSSQGDDRTINHRYWYGMADAMRLTLAIRQNYLDYDNMPIKGGEQFSALRENHHHIFLADPYHIENFANALRDDVDLLITRWQQMPNTLLIPILGGMHWRIVQIKVDYEQKTIKICWDDPYGEKHFPTHMRQSILEAVKQHISKLIQKQRYRPKKCVWLF
jgi:tetratricopeptide (TPR) repeat protein